MHVVTSSQCRLSLSLRNGTSDIGGYYLGVWVTTRARAGHAQHCHRFIALTAWLRLRVLSDTLVTIDPCVVTYCYGNTLRTRKEKQPELKIISGSVRPTFPSLLSLLSMSSSSTQVTEFHSCHAGLPAIPDDLSIPQFFLDHHLSNRPLRPRDAPWLIDDDTGMSVDLEQVRLCPPSSRPFVTLTFSSRSERVPMAWPIS
jgi:hypothetical protein